MNQTDSKYLTIIKDDMEIPQEPMTRSLYLPYWGWVNIILTSCEAGGIIYHKTEFK